nr:hypothetical protein [Lunatimonas salinarum]
MLLAFLGTTKVARSSEGGWMWMRRNPWFEEEVVPHLCKKVFDLLY